MSFDAPLIKIHDKNLKIVGFLTPQMYFNSKWARKLIKGNTEVATFDFSVYKNKTSEVIQFIDEKSWISFNLKGRSYLFSAVKVIENKRQIDLECDSLNLELVNETSVAYKAPRAMTFVQYFNILGLNLSQLKIGINELSTYTRSLEWEGQDTKLARLISLVTKFDGELEFIDELNRDGTLKQITLNLYQKHSETAQGVGTRRNDLTLFWRKNIDSITRTVDKTNLYTAIRPVGTDGLTIASLNKTELDEDGNVLFISPQNQASILCPSVANEYPSQVQYDNTDIYTKLDWTYETKNVNTLYGQALAKLKEIYLPAISYEVDGFFDAEIGDTLKIHDEGFSPVLLLEARVTAQEIYFKNPKANKTTFDNFRALQNRLSESITQRLQEITAPITDSITSDKPLNMKNVPDDVSLTCHLFRNNSEIDLDGVLFDYSWKINLFSISGEILKTIENTGKAVELLATDWIDGAVTFLANVEYKEVENGTD